MPYDLLQDQKPQGVFSSISGWIYIEHQLHIQSYCLHWRMTKKIINFLSPEETYCVG